MHRFVRLAPIVLLALAAARCASVSVGSHVASGIDFARYHTFDWGPADALPTGDPRLDRNTLFQDRVQGAVERQMTLRGFERGTPGHTDLLIHYHANISRRLDVSAPEARDGGCYAVDCKPGITQYEAGTLVLDIVDARTNRLIWRGWARHSVEDMLGDPDRMTRTINEAVSRMLARLPRTL